MLILNRGRVVAEGTVAEVAQPGRGAAPRARSGARPRTAEPRGQRPGRACAGVERVSTLDGQPGWLTRPVRSAGRRQRRSHRRTRPCAPCSTPASRCCSFELEGARLSDAFLAMTGPAEMAAVAPPRPRARTARWAVVLEQELRDLWLGRPRPRAAASPSASSLSVIAYLVATNTDLNFLEQRESVNLTLQVAIAVGALLALLVAADAISGERERGTLETPAAHAGPRRADRDRQAARRALAVARGVRGHRAVRLVPRPRRRRSSATRSRRASSSARCSRSSSRRSASSISVFSGSNRSASRSACSCCSRCSRRRSCPRAPRRAGPATLLLRFNPVTAGEHYVGKIVVNGHSWSEDISWLVSPVVAAVLFAVLGPARGGRFMALRGGVSG